MQLKTFSARSSAAVLSKIRAEFGSEAVILETREEGGLVYMTAALERDNISLGQHGAGSAQTSEDGLTDRPGGTKRQQPAASRKEKKEEGISPASKTTEACGGKSRADAYGQGAAAKRAYRNAAPLHPAEAEALLPKEPFQHQSHGLDWQEEWSSIKGHILALMKPAMRLDELAPRQRLALEYLQRQGVEDEAILHLYERLRDKPEANVLSPLADLVRVRPWSEENWPQRVQLITGPFGSGKTSVAIRMALSLRRSSPDCRICLVNADATRGNGRLLLRHYCELSELVYKEASSTLELVACLSSAEREGYDRILVDLPGLARDKRLETLLADAGLDARCGERPGDAAVHLALPPHYGSTELRAILDRYRCPHAGSIVWTKLDEAEHYGQIVNVGIRTGLPVSALSYGPGLGNSLAPAREVMLWRLLFKREFPSGN